MLLAFRGRMTCAPRQPRRAPAGAQTHDAVVGRLSRWARREQGRLHAQAARPDAQESCTLKIQRPLTNAALLLESSLTASRRPASFGMLARHQPEWWPGFAGIRTGSRGDTTGTTISTSGAKRSRPGLRCLSSSTRGAPELCRSTQGGSGKFVWVGCGSDG